MWLLLSPPSSAAALSAPLPPASCPAKPETNARHTKALAQMHVTPKPSPSHDAEVAVQSMLSLRDSPLHLSRFKQTLHNVTPAAASRVTRNALFTPMQECSALPLLFRQDFDGASGKLKEGEGGGKNTWWRERLKRSCSAAWLACSRRTSCFKPLCTN